MLLYSKYYFENQLWLIKRYARKNIHHGCMVWIEKSVNRDHSASLVMPIIDPRDRFFLTYETEFVLFLAVLENYVLPMG